MRAPENRMGIFGLRSSVGASMPRLRALPVTSGTMTLKSQIEYTIGVTRNARHAGMTKAQFLEAIGLAWDALDLADAERLTNFRHCPDCGTPEGGLHETVCPALNREGRVR